jgi:hypothetical protein
MGIKALEVYEQLCKLKDDPEAFNQAADEIMQQHINETVPVGDRERYHQQLWAMNKKLDTHKNPIDRMNEMVKIFWEGFFVFKNTLDNPVPNKNANNDKADVTPMSSKKDNN